METKCKCNHGGLRVKLIHPDAKLPTKSYESAGYDLYVPFSGRLRAGQRRLFKTGITADLPHGYFGRIADRSGVAYNLGVTVLAGVIDNDYRGDIGVILYNTTDEDVFFKRGDRIAQMVLLPYGNFDVIEVDDLTDTERSGCGFGSTGR